LIRRIQQGLGAEGITLSIAKLCAWFGVLRRTVYYKPVKAAPRIDPRFAEPIKAAPEPPTMARCDTNCDTDKALPGQIRAPQQEKTTT